MIIRIYGPGCIKCKFLKANVQTALEELNKTAAVEKVEDLGKIILAGIMMVPALEIDGRVVSQGRVLSSEEIKKFL